MMKRHSAIPLGLLIHRLLTGKHAFGWPEISIVSDTITTLKQIDYIIPMLFLEPNIDRENLPEPIVSIVEGLLLKDPKERMSTEEAYNKLLSSLQ